MKRIYIAGMVVVVAGVLGLVYYGISPLFRTIHVEDVALKEGAMTQDEKDSMMASSSETMMKAEEGNKAMMEKKTAPVTGTAGHPASGEVGVVHAEDGTYIRYENFKTINGPDLYVYVSKDLEAKEFVSLGEIRGTEGNINYKVPEGVSLKEYKYVLTWCKQFGVLFNSAEVGSL